jgi:hypothetical protein
VNLGLRPEHALADGAGESLSGRVQMVEHLGEVNLLYLTLDCGADAVVRGDGGQAVQIGQRLSFQVDMAAFHLFDESGRAMRRLQPGNLAATRRVPAAAEARRGGIEGRGMSLRPICRIPLRSPWAAWLLAGLCLVASVLQAQAAGNAPQAGGVLAAALAPISLRWDVVRSERLPKDRGARSLVRFVMTASPTQALPAHGWSLFFTCVAGVDLDSAQGPFVLESHGRHPVPPAPDASFCRPGAGPASGTALSPPRPDAQPGQGTPRALPGDGQPARHRPARGRLSHRSAAAARATGPGRRPAPARARRRRLLPTPRHSRCGGPGPAAPGLPAAARMAACRRQPALDAHAAHRSRRRPAARSGLGARLAAASVCRRARRHGPRGRCTAAPADQQLAGGCRPDFT